MKRIWNGFVYLFVGWGLICVVGWNLLGVVILTAMALQWLGVVEIPK